MGERRFEKITDAERKRGALTAGLIVLILGAPFLVVGNYTAAFIFAAFGCMSALLVGLRKKRRLPDLPSKAQVDSSAIWRSVESLIVGLGLLALLASIIFLPFHLSQTATADELAELGACEKQLGRKAIVEDSEPLSRFDLVALRWRCHDQEEVSEAVSEQLEALSR